MADAVGLVFIEVGYQPLAVHLLHIELMFLYVRGFVERTILPFLAHLDGGDRVGVVGFLHTGHFKVGDSAAVAGHKIVEPFVVHGLELRQLVEHRVQHVVEIRCHIRFRLLRQFVVGDVLAQLGHTFLQLFFRITTCRKQERGDGKNQDFFHSNTFFNCYLQKSNLYFQA